MTRPCLVKVYCYVSVANQEMTQERHEVDVHIRLLQNMQVKSMCPAWQVCLPAWTRGGGIEVSHAGTEHAGRGCTCSGEAEQDCQNRYFADPIENFLGWGSINPCVIGSLSSVGFWRS